MLSLRTQRIADDSAVPARSQDRHPLRSITFRMGRSAAPRSRSVKIHTVGLTILAPHIMDANLRGLQVSSTYRQGPLAMNQPFDPGYYDEFELSRFGFKSVGTHVRVAKNCTIIGLENISFGNHVRIDGYTSLIAAGSGKLTIGSYVHLGSGCFLSAGQGIVLEDFAGLSQGVRIYSRTDDYSGQHLTNPTVPERFTGVVGGEVVLKRHVILGSGTVVLPRVTIGEGASVGALSLVTKSLEPWGVYFGCPARRLKSRSKRLLELEAELMRDAPRSESEG